MFIVFREAIMTFFDNRVEQLGENIVRFFVTCYYTNCSDEGMARIVDSWKTTNIDSSYTILHYAVSASIICEKQQQQQ